MEYKLSHNIRSFIQSEMVFDAIHNHLNKMQDIDTLTIEVTTDNPYMGRCENKIQLAHYINVLLTLQRLSLICKRLYDNNSDKNYVNGKLFLLSSVLLTYLHSFPEHLFKVRTLKDKNPSLIEPRIVTMKNKVEEIMLMITDSNINPCIASYTITQQTKFLETLIKNFHKKLLQPEKLYYNLKMKIPFTDKYLFNYYIPKWKYRYLHHLFKEKNYSTISLLSIKQDLDGNYKHLDPSWLYEVIIERTLIRTFEEYRKYLPNHSDLHNFKRLLKIEYSKLFIHNKQIKTEITL